MSHRRIALVAAALCACATAHPPAPAPDPRTVSGDVDARRKAFDALLAEHWEYFLSHAPEYASILGDKRWNDKSSDLSAAAVAANLAKSREFLARFEAVDVTGFSEQEALTRTLVVRAFREELDNARFENWKMPVNQMGGIHLRAAQFVALLPFGSAKDYDDYLARLRALPRQLADTEANMRLGMAAGLMPPRFLLEKVRVAGGGHRVRGSRWTPRSPARSPRCRRTSLLPSRSGSGRRCSLPSRTTCCPPTGGSPDSSATSTPPRAGWTWGSGPSRTARPATPPA